MSAVEFLSVEGVADLLQPSCYFNTSESHIHLQTRRETQKCIISRIQPTKGAFIQTKTALKLHLKRHTSLPNLGECRILLDSFDRITCKNPKLFYYVQ